MIRDIKITKERTPVGRDSIVSRGIPVTREERHLQQKSLPRRWLALVTERHSAKGLSGTMGEWHS